MIFPKLSRFGARLSAAIVVLGTSVVMVNSVTTLTLAVPNAVTFSYALPGGGLGPSFTFPAAATQRPLLVMGANITVGNRGVGHVSLLQARTPPSFLMWVGQNSDPTSITQGFSDVAGTPILFIDFAHDVSIEVANAFSIRVHNVNAAAQTGIVTLIW